MLRVVVSCGLGDQEWTTINRTYVNSLMMPTIGVVQVIASAPRLLPFLRPVVEFEDGRRVERNDNDQKEAA